MGHKLRYEKVEVYNVEMLCSECGEVMRDCTSSNISSVRWYKCKNGHGESIYYTEQQYPYVLHKKTGESYEQDES